MHDILRNIDPEKQKQRAWLFALLLTSYITYFMVMGTFGEVDTSGIQEMNPIYLLIAQGFISSLMFIGVALLFAKITLRLNPDDFFPSIRLESFVFILLITISFMVVNSAIGEWNMNLDFPDSEFERWAKRSEDQLRQLTEHLTNFTSPLHFIIALIVVAIIPGIGEELLFRGLIQNFFVKAFSNHHAAIWFTGFIFAAIHMQFYGLIPRMLLGVLFGYIYYWSSNLTLAMLAHILNNGLALCLLYFAQSGTIDVPPDQMESSAPWPAILIFGIVGAFLLRRFYIKFAVENE